MLLSSPCKPDVMSSQQPPDASGLNMPSAGYNLWTQAVIRDQVLDMLHRPDGEVKQDGALANLLTVNKATFESSIILLYKEIGDFPASGRLFQSTNPTKIDLHAYMCGAKASAVRTYTYASKVRKIIRSTPVSELDEAGLPAYFALYPQAETIFIPIAPKVGSPLGDTPIVELILRMDHVAMMIESICIEVMRELVPVAEATMFLADLFITEGVQQRYLVKRLRFGTDVVADFAILYDGLLKGGLPGNLTLDFAPLESLKVESVALSGTQLSQVAKLCPKLKLLDFHAGHLADDAATRALLRQIPGSWPQLMSLRISTDVESGWSVSLRQTMDMLAGQLPNLVDLAIVLVPGMRMGGSSSEDLVFGSPPEPKYPKLRTLILRLVDCNTAMTSTLSANGQLLVLVSRSCRVETQVVFSSDEDDVEAMAAAAAYKIEFDACRAAILRNWSKPDVKPGWKLLENK